MDKVIEIILETDDVGKGINGSIKFIQEEAEKLRKNEVPIEKLVLSKKLSKPMTDYDNKAIHSVVAKKMLSRGKKVEIGDRVSYLIMNNGKKLISDKAEDVEYVIENNLIGNIDKEYYITHQLLAPVSRVLEVLGIKNINVDGKRQRTLMDF
jgi:DNA polymerase elongation subunit (family B)